jgi:hypothetical protein
MIAALAACCALAVSIAPSEAAPAETCAASPKPAAPEGSHWYYRTDRATQRKCWYLATKDHKGRLAARPAELRAEPKARDVAPAPAAPVMKEGVERLTQPFDAGAPNVQSAGAAPQSAPMAPARGDAASSAASSSMNAVQPGTAEPPAAPLANAPAAMDQPVAAVAPQDRAAPDVQSATPAADPSQQAVPQAAPTVAAPSPTKSTAARAQTDDMRMLPFAIAVFAAAIVLAGAILYASARRRQDAIVRIVDLNARAPARGTSRVPADTLSDAPFDSELDDAATAPRRMPPPWRRAAA